LSKVIGSGTGRLSPVPVRVGFINEAQLKHGLSSLGETNTDPAEDRADHTLASQVAAIDLIYLPSSGSNSKYGREAYMVE
jgi:hypothetical protein